ncbi:MAG: acyl-CoA dehydrogenase family protein [Novosphingobium sp.]|uniref:acyl-CoA dehydrogenase family protein n=1 Tax=Novosphingobium sp. TaxID=1874826 RepID=UPI003017E49A
MNFDLDENQELFKAAVERFCQGQDVAARRAARSAPGGIDRARWKELAELGLIGLAAAEADGGMEGSAADLAVVAQALGYAQAVEPWLECGFLPARLLAGSTHLEGVIAGETVAAFAFAEPGRRFVLDAQGVKMRAGKLSGTKQFVLGGGAADIFVVSAEDDGKTGLYVVDAKAAEVEVRPYPVADGGVAAIVTFHDAVAEGPLAADLGAVIDEARLMAAAEMTGIAQRLFADTLDYLKTREQFGQPLGRFQVLQHRMVDAYARVESVQSAILRALLQPAAPMAAIKAHVAENAIWVGHQAVQLHGGMGMSDELGVGHGLKRIVLLSKLFGDPASDILSYAQAA